MKIKFILLAVNVAFLVNFVDHTKLQKFKDDNSEFFESTFSEDGEYSKFKEFSLAFQNRFQHHVENFKENLNMD